MSAQSAASITIVSNANRNRPIENTIFFSKVIVRTRLQ